MSFASTVPLGYMRLGDTVELEGLPFVYLPLSQHYQPIRFLHVRADSSAETLLPRVAQAIQDLEPDSRQSV